MTDPDGISGLSQPRVGGIMDALRHGNIKGDEARLRGATDALEGTFYQELFKAMRESVPESGLLDGGSGEDSFTAMLDQHLADVQAARSERGIGQALYRWFTEGRGEGL
jgi:Rod binding domain-containing protein